VRTRAWRVITQTDSSQFRTCGCGQRRRGDHLGDVSPDRVAEGDVGQGERQWPIPVPLLRRVGAAGPRTRPRGANGTDEASRKRRHELSVIVWRAIADLKRAELVKPLVDHPRTRHRQCYELTLSTAKNADLSTAKKRRAPELRKQQHEHCENRSP
jgi:hypothetical protein